MPLTSAHNPRVQKIRKAAHAGRPTPDGFIVAEGPHLLEEALHSPWTVVEILCTPEAFPRFSNVFSKISAPTTELSEQAFASIATTENPQGVIALLQPRAWSWADLATRPALLVVLDGVQDPGNVGTIVRSAEAFGASGIILAQGTARVSNGKVLRAAAGSLFRMPFLEAVSRTELGEWLAAEKVKLYALAAGGQGSLLRTDFRGNCAVVVGNEGSGVSAELCSMAETVTIPTIRVESLNASIACAVTLFEAARQRNNR